MKGWIKIIDENNACVLINVDHIYSIGGVNKTLTIRDVLDDETKEIELESKEKFIECIEFFENNGYLTIKL